MKKLILGVALSLSQITSAFAWEEGDTAYIFAKNAGKATWFSSDLIYYAKVSIERLTNNKAKVYIEKMCWRVWGGDVHCNKDTQGGYSPGSYTWVSKSSLYSYVPED